MKKNTTKLIGVVALAALLPSVAFSQTIVPPPGVVVQGDADVQGDAIVGGDIIGSGQITDGNGYNVTDIQYQVWKQHVDDVYIQSLADANTATLAIHEGLVLQNIDDIAANTATLVVHEGLVLQNIDDIAAINDIIYVDGDGAVHIGEESLVTALDGDVQLLWAESGGEVIPINIITDTNVDGTFTVQGSASDPVTTTDDILDPNPPYLLEDGIVADTVAVYTEKGDVSVVTETFDNSGVEVTTDGNVTLNTSGGAIQSIAYVTAIRQDIWDETQGALAGQLQGTVEVGGYIDADGNFVELGTLEVDGDLDGQGVLMLDQAMIDELAMVVDENGDPVYVMLDESAGDGGNLQVGGDANVDGVLSVGEVADVEGTLNTHFDLVSQNIADIDANEMAIADNASDIADNAATLVVHEGLVTQNIADIAANAADIADEEAARMAADDALAADLAAEEAARMAADDALAADLAAETARATGREDELWSALGDEADIRQAGDDAIVAGYQADDAAIVAAFSADVADLTAADAALGQGLTDEAAAREAGDADLQAQIDNEAANRAAGDANLWDAVDAEAAARASADSALSSSLNSHVSNIWDELEMVSNQVEKNTRGIAMVAAMTSPTVREGMENALDFHLAHFDGETGAAISYARRINENTQLNIAAASTTDFDESVVRGGVSLQW